MRYVTIAAALLMLAACDMPGAMAQDARKICATNGHTPGTAAFDACFQATLATIYPSSPAVAIR